MRTRRAPRLEPEFPQEVEPRSHGITLGFPLFRGALAITKTIMIIIVDDDTEAGSASLTSHLRSGAAAGMRSRYCGSRIYGIR